MSGDYLFPFFIIALGIAIVWTILKGFKDRPEC